MPNGNGYFLTWRKIFDDWKGANCHTGWAWVWMVSQANYADDKPTPGLKRGQLVLKRLSQLATVAGWPDKVYAHRFLVKCIQECDVTEVKRSSNEGVTLSICDYDEYQPDCNGSVTDVKRLCNGSDIQSLKKELRSTKSTPFIPLEGDKPKKKSVKKTLPLLKAKADLEMALETLRNDLEKFRQEFERQGVDVDYEFGWGDSKRGFCHYVLEGDAKSPWPNPSNWRDFTAAFRNSCQRTVDKIAVGKLAPMRKSKKHDDEYSRRAPAPKEEDYLNHGE